MFATSINLRILLRTWLNVLYTFFGILYELFFKNALHLLYGSNRKSSRAESLGPLVYGTISGFCWGSVALLPLAFFTTLPVNLKPSKSFEIDQICELTALNFEEIFRNPSKSFEID